LQSSPASHHFLLLTSNIILSTTFSDTLNLCYSLVWQIKFHTHKNNWENYSKKVIKLTNAYSAVLRNRLHTNNMVQTTAKELYWAESFLRQWELLSW
jgi:hypothetical protein